MQRLLIDTLRALGAWARALTRMSIKQRSLTEGTRQLTLLQSLLMHDTTIRLHNMSKMYILKNVTSELMEKQ